MLSLLILLLILAAIYYINHAIPFSPDWMKMIIDVVLGLIAIIQIIYFLAPLLPSNLGLK